MSTSLNLYYLHKSKILTQTTSYTDTESAALSRLVGFVKSVKEFITWERLAVSLIGILIALISFVGKGIVTEVEAMRKTMVNLNDTLYSIKIETALTAQNNATIAKRIEDMNFRIYELEKRGRR